MSSDKMEFPELGVGLDLPPGWIKHPDENLFRPEDDDGKTFPPTMEVAHYPDQSYDDFVKQSRDRIESAGGLTFVDQEERSVNKCDGTLLAWRADEVNFLFNNVIAKGPKGVTTFTYYAPEKAFTSGRRLFLKVLRSVRWL